VASEAPCYLYGIVRADDADRVPAVRGVTGAEVTTISSGDLAAVVSPLADVDLRPTRNDLLAHSDVLQAIVERCDVVPLRFGHIFVRAEQVRRELLGRDAESLLHTLDDLGGAVELHVKASYREEVVLAELMRSDRRLQRLRSGRQDHARRLELGRHVADLLDARRHADAGHILDRAGRLATRTSVGSPSGDFGVVDAAFLVPRRTVPAFLDEADRLAAEASTMTVRTMGPMAPYSFVGETLAGAA
jgi:hypothetical protein